MTHLSIQDDRFDCGRDSPTRHCVASFSGVIVAIFLKPFKG
jgi:hypothetical protein